MLAQRGQAFTAVRLDHPALRRRVGILIRTIRHHIFAYGRECAMAVVDEGGAAKGEATMTIKILNEFLLFSCLAAFVTGIVLAAASLLI
jgi:hypothetical protein